MVQPRACSCGRFPVEREERIAIPWLAGRLAIGRTTAWEIVVERGEIPSERVSERKLVVPRSDAEAWLAERRVEALGGSAAVPRGLDDQYLTVEQAARLLYQSRSAVHRMLAVGELACYRLATRLVRVARADVDAYLEARRRRWAA